MSLFFYQQSGPFFNEYKINNDLTHSCHSWQNQVVFSTFWCRCLYLFSESEINSPTSFKLKNWKFMLQIISFEAILNGIYPEILSQVPREDVPHIVKYLTTVALYCSRPFCCLVACRCLAAIVNKFFEGLFSIYFEPAVALSKFQTSNKTWNVSYLSPRLNFSPINAFKMKFEKNRIHKKICWIPIICNIKL